MISIPGLKSIVNEVLVSCSATVDPTELSEQDKMNKFLNMSEDEYAEALEEAMEIEKKGSNEIHSYHYRMKLQLIPVGYYFHHEIACVY